METELVGLTEIRDVHCVCISKVLKCLTDGVDNSSGQKEGVNCVMQCKHCFETVRGPYCLKCKRIVSHCAICHIPVKGNEMH